MALTDVAPQRSMTVDVGPIASGFLGSCREGSIWDLAGNVIAETDGTAAGTVREYIWLPEAEIAPTDQSQTQIDRSIAVVDGVGGTPSLWMVHVDHLNRPIKMTDATKASVWDAVWLPWGGAHVITGTATLNARLPGQWFQLEAGLHYNWHRSYDPTIGRYTQPDPLSFVDGPSVYGYAGGSPGQYVDPDGLNWLRKLREIAKDVHVEGPGKDYAGYGHGRICQIRYKEWFIRLDYDPVPKVSPKEPIYHLNIGSSKPGKSNVHIPVNPKRWF